ncbi:hypothetical protein WAK64_11775 [Bacillus spongiae]|uniref:Oligosaccharide flippase family protein n=1 Tax=Bacillus spongiae TaxID=2683610 RepID=A0ABU8HEN0_9BACI
MRTKHSLNNIFIGIISQLVIVILGFISRKIFLDSLGIDYLGINGLLTNVLSMLALVEGGIGLSIVYNLYKPLAEKDQKKVIALVQLYKKVYGYLAVIILIISICLYPFLGGLIKDDSSISNLTMIYFLFIAKNLLSYLNAHKWSLIYADQRGYVLDRMNLLFQVITTIAKIIILIVTKDFILYLIIEFLLYGVQVIVNGKIVDRRYPYIRTKVKYSLDEETKTNIKTNVKALFLHNIGGFLVFGTDNLLISSFIGLATVGIYSNYTMIITQLNAFVKPILGGVGASIGNLIATEGSEKNYFIFQITYLVNFWIYSTCVIFLFNLLDPFISWWFGSEYVFTDLILVFILINFYLTGMRTSIATFKNKAGLFKQDKYAPLIEGGINLISSLILVKYYGLVGIFIGTTLSTLLTVFWTQPIIVYKHVFKKSFVFYYQKYFLYLLIGGVAFTITTAACQAIVFEQELLTLVVKGIISLLIPAIIYGVVFFKTEELKYMIQFLKRQPFFSKVVLVLKKSNLKVEKS